MNIERLKRMVIADRELKDDVKKIIKAQLSKEDFNQEVEWMIWESIDRCLIAIGYYEEEIENFYINGGFDYRTIIADVWHDVIKGANK